MKCLPALVLHILCHSVGGLAVSCSASPHPLVLYFIYRVLQKIKKQNAFPTWLAALLNLCSNTFWCALLALLCPHSSCDNIVCICPGKPGGRKPTQSRVVLGEETQKGRELCSAQQAEPASGPGNYRP